MSGFEPGEGWREMPHLGDRELPKDCVAYLQPEGGWRYWVRVPPLPTEPGYYVDQYGCAWRLDADGEWDDTFGNPLTEDSDGQPQLPLVRYEPRAVTAKAVLDRALHLSDTGSYIEEAIHQVRGEFGVSS